MSEKLTIEQLEERRAERKKVHADAEAEQFATDLAALDALEIEHGDGTIGAVKVQFKKGHPTRAFFKTPTKMQYDRYRKQIQKAVEKKNLSAQYEAQELLAKSCWIYPVEQEAKDEMIDSFPGLYASMAIGAASLAEGRNEEEGKG